MRGMAQQGADPRRWRALAVTLAAGFMSLLDVSIVNVALPSIQRGLEATASDVQWVVSGYALTFGLALVAGGRLGDVLGRRVMFLGALAGFVLTSAAAGAAPTITMLIVARLLQGLAAGMLTPQNTGLIQDLFSGAERGRAFGLFGAMVGFSTAVGPVLGGLIIAGFGVHDGWRWVFYVNAPVGVLAFVLAMRLVPHTPRHDGRIRDRIDFVGALLLGLAVLCVLLPVLQAEQLGLQELSWLFPLALVFGYAFLRWERAAPARGKAPLLDTRLFGVRGFFSGATLGAVYFCGFAGIWLVFSMFYQFGLGYSALHAGLVVTPFALGSAVSAAIAGRLVAQRGRWLTVTGLSLVAVGLSTVAILVTVVPGDKVGWVSAVPMLIAGIGGGAVISPNTTLTLQCVPKRMFGVAGGVLQTGQRLGAAIGTAVLAAVFHGVVAATGQHELAASVAIAAAVAVIGVALVLAVMDLRAGLAQRWREDLAEATEESAVTDVHRC